MIQGVKSPDTMITPYLLASAMLDSDLTQTLGIQAAIDSTALDSIKLITFMAAKSQYEKVLIICEAKNEGFQMFSKINLLL